MKKKNDGYCSGYCGIACVDGSCPLFNMVKCIGKGKSVTHFCINCFYYKGCVDCCFFGTELCVEAENGKE